MIYKAEEWEGAAGWYCNCISNIARGSGTWYYPARILGITPAEFLKILFKNFKPDHFYFNPESCFCSWSWTSQTAMRKYKNWLNKKARENNFQI